MMMESLQQLFQCGSMDQVDDVAPGGGRTRTTSDSTKESSIPDLKASNSSTSSIYVVPSREALEDLVRDSQTTKRQGLFDMDRLFACGSGANVGRDPAAAAAAAGDADVDDWDEDATQGSVFSRTAPQQLQQQQQLLQRQQQLLQRKQQRQERKAASTKVVYSSTPSTPAATPSPSSPHCPSWELRKTKSDSVTPVPDSPRNDASTLSPPSSSNE